LLHGLAACEGDSFYAVLIVRTKHFVSYGIDGDVRPCKGMGFGIKAPGTGEGATLEEDDCA
jgi:hypothetical protein